MRKNITRGFAPIAAIIVALLIIGGGAYGIKKAIDKKTVKNKEAAEAGLPAPEQARQAGMPVPGTDTPEMIVSPTPEETRVIYNSQGFSPKTVTIKKGDMVVFENKTGKPASVASDEHPTHLLYPEFDQYKTAERGKTEFRFTFEKVGTWKYHDHLNSTMTGTVIVE